MSDSPFVVADDCECGNCAEIVTVAESLYEIVSASRTCNENKVFALAAVMAAIAQETKNHRLLSMGIEEAAMLLGKLQEMQTPTVAGTVLS